MSQIPRSQFTLKKHKNVAAPNAPMQFMDLEHQNGAKGKKSHSNGSGNGHKNDHHFENDVVIIDDFLSVTEVEVSSSPPIQFEDISPSKKKSRSRKSKDSTESKDSDVSKKANDKTQEKNNKSPQKATQEKVAYQTVVIDVAKTETVATSTEAKETKIIKLTYEALANSGRRSGRGALQNASTIVNLSSVSTSDQSTKMSTDETFDSTNYVPERRVSGRRSTRPIDDIKFGYRSPDANDSLNGTTNATIGSEVANDSLLATPATDRKRRPDSDSMETLESPKRSRLDLSGLFSSFSSPVALLRNKFKRTNIASTPAVGQGTLLDESIESEEGDKLEEIDLNEKPETVEGDNKEEELEVITTPIKKRSCTVM